MPSRCDLLTCELEDRTKEHHHTAMKSILMLRATPLFCPPVQQHPHQLKGVYTEGHAEAHQEHNFLAFLVRDWAWVLAASPYLYNLCQTFPGTLQPWSNSMSGRSSESLPSHFSETKPSKWVSQLCVSYCKWFQFFMLLSMNDNLSWHRNSES